MDEVTKRAMERRDRFMRESVGAWSDMIEDIFSPEPVPLRHSWHDLDDIINILNKAGTGAVTNHLFIPSGGGLDVTSAKRSVEDGCIEIHFGGLTTICRPEGLYLETFAEQPDHMWSYFRIETNELEPSGVYDSLTFNHEELTELRPKEYVDLISWDHGVYGYDEYGDELPLPRNARPVSRYFRGAFVIFAKGSLYNFNTRTYDARHNKMSATGFRKHIESVIAYLKDREC